MRQRLTALLLLLALLIPFAPLGAQYVNESVCTSEDMQVELMLVAGMNDQLETMLTDGTAPEDILAWIQIANGLMDGIVARCAGLGFEGTGDQVIGPLTFNGGIYRAQMMTDGLAQLEVETVSGDCGRDHLLLNTVSTAGGVEALFQPGVDCVGMFEVGANSAWQLRFERVDTPAAGEDVEVTATSAPK